MDSNYKKSNMIFTGKRIAKCRNAAGLSQSELASKLGVSKKLISAMELGNRALTQFNAGPLGEALGVFPEYLLGEVDYRNQEEKIRLEENEERLISEIRSINKKLIDNQRSAFLDTILSPLIRLSCFKDAASDKYIISYAEKAENMDDLRQLMTAHSYRLKPNKKYRLEDTDGVYIDKNDGTICCRVLELDEDQLDQLIESINETMTENIKLLLSISGTNIVMPQKAE